jgi:hypothetical protein
MLRFRYVRYCTLSEVRDYWRNKADGGVQYIRKWSQFKGLPCVPTQLILIMMGEWTLVEVYLRNIFGALFICTATINNRVAKSTYETSLYAY